MINLYKIEYDKDKGSGGFVGIDDCRLKILSQATARGLKQIL